MGSLETPKSWVPYENIRDCSKGFCSFYCPQWCYIIFPPPPPPLDQIPDIIHNSTPTFSPLLVAIIGILASAFLLVCYYTIISNYCGKTDANGSPNGRRSIGENQQEGEDGEVESPYEPWQVSSIGLDDALIKKITMFKYKRGDGLVEGRDCLVCLNEFEEDEWLRLLPKCSHAFHVGCIDTWLKSHSNCPLCRANIVFIAPSLPTNPIQDGQSSIEESVSNDEVVQNGSNSPKPDTIIDIREEERRQKRIRRSFSMDHPRFQSRASVADILRMDDDDDEEDLSLEEGGSNIEVNKSGGRRKRRGVSLKRSFSSGRFYLSGRVSESVSICHV